MDQEISPKQTLFLLRLLTQQEGFFLGKAKPELSAAERKQLLDADLIKVEKQKQSPKSRAANYATLTEKGWNWAEKHLDAPLPTSGTAGLIVLNKLLQLLKANIAAGEFSLAEFFTVADRATSPSELANVVQPASTVHEAPSTPLSLDVNDGVQSVGAVASLRESSELQSSGELSEDIKRRLYNACVQIAGDGIYGTRIRLADLRSKLPDVPRQELDRALRDLEQTEAAAIMPLDDPREIRPDDEDAALSNSQGKNRHILYLSNPS